LEKGHAVSAVANRLYIRRQLVDLTFVPLCRPTGNYGDDLAKVIRQVLLVGRVAALSNSISRGKSLDEIHERAAVLAMNTDNPNVDVSDYEIRSERNESSAPFDTREERRDRYTGSLSQSQKNEIMSLLDSWEEPETGKKSGVSG
jgi:hypothetical protein